MTDKNLNDFMTGWLIGDIVDETTKNGRRNSSGCSTFLFLLFIGFILFSILAITGIEMSKVWSFLKIVTFPVTWDYQLLDFKLFGTNNYFSTIGSLGLIFVFYLILKLLDRVILKDLEGKVLNRTIGRFQPIHTAINIISIAYELFVNIAAFFIMVLMIKVMVHGFLSIFTFIFSL